MPRSSKPGVSHALRRTAFVAGGFLMLIALVALVLTVKQSIIGARSGGYSVAPGVVGVAAPAFESADKGVRSAADISVDAVSRRDSSGTLTERKITKNGMLSLLVQDAETAATDIAQVASRFGGFVSSSQIYEVREGVETGSIAIRVPAAQFENAVRDVKALAIRVEREQVSATDVTEQFVDLEARLKNSRAEERQFLDILERADTVEDTLNVVQHLNRVRGQIEHLEGQLQFLSRQVEMSTISVSLTEEADAEVFGIRWRPLVVAKLALRELLQGLSRYANAMIRILFVLPVLLAWLLTAFAVAWAVWRIGRRVWQKFFTP